MRMIPIRQFQKQEKGSYRGVSLVELLVAIGIISILFTVGWLALPRWRTESELDLWASEAKVSLYQAQSQTVNGIPSGVYFETGRFVLFQGDAFVEGNPKNQENQLPASLNIISISLPDSTVTFEKVTGYVKNFSDPANLTLQDQNTGRMRIISINEVGMAEVE